MPWNVWGRGCAMAITMSALGAILAPAPPTAAKERSRRSQAARVATRSAPAPSRPAARTASRPAPRVRVAKGTATYGRGGHDRIHFVSVRPYFWYPWWGWGYANGWWWGWPYLYPYYPPPRSYPYYGPAATEEVQGAPAVVEIDAAPSSAAVELDGEEVGLARDYNGAWDRLEISPGAHVISLSAPGYKTLEVQLEASPASYHRFVYRLEKGEGLDPRSNARKGLEAPAPERYRRGPPSAGAVTVRGGFLRVRVAPADAAVYLDGDFLARAGELARLHGALPVAAGSHRVEAVRPGYRSASEEVTVEDGGRSEVILELERSGS